MAEQAFMMLHFFLQKANLEPARYVLQSLLGVPNASSLGLQQVDTYPTILLVQVRAVVFDANHQRLMENDLKTLFACDAVTVTSSDSVSSYVRLQTSRLEATSAAITAVNHIYGVARPSSHLKYATVLSTQPHVFETVLSA